MPFLCCQTPEQQLPVFANVCQAALISCSALSAGPCPAERGVDISGVQTVDKPTRDVLVVYDQDGDRQFVGFGGPNDSFADCFISAEQLPLDTLRSCVAMVTGTLGLAFPATAEAMHKAVETARTGPAVVRLNHASFLPGACSTLFARSPCEGTHLSRSSSL